MGRASRRRLVDVSVEFSDDDIGRELRALLRGMSYGERKLLERGIVECSEVVSEYKGRTVRRVNLRRLIAWVDAH